MKSTVIITLIVVALLVICIGMTMHNQSKIEKAEAKKLEIKKPELSNGNSWKYTQEHYDQGLLRYTIRIESLKRVTQEEAKLLAEYTRVWHDKSDNHIIFFDQPDRMGAYLKVTYPAGTFEELENYER